MTTEELRRLEERVDRLERELETLRTPISPATQVPATPAYVAAPSPPPPPPPPHTGLMARRPGHVGDEASVVGSWLARIGAVAVVIGAAFAFKYAIDRGLIGPEARVLIGIIVGFGFAAASEWARRRDWHGWAQAVAGGAVGLWYLSVWAAYQLYALIDPLTALAGFSLITLAAIGLALRHDSEPLAVLAVGTAFINPFLVGVLRPAPVFAYVLLIDVGVAVLVALQGWRSLERVALIFTWGALALTPGESLGIALVFATTYFSLFTLLAMQRTVGGDPAAEGEDAVFLTMNSFAYAAFTLALLNEHASDWMGAFCVLLGAVHVILAIFVGRAGHDIPLRNTLALLGALLFVLAVPLQLDGAVVPAVWTIQSVALIGAAGAFRSDRLAAGGIALLVLAILETFAVEVGSGYPPERLLFTGTSLLLALEVAALAVSARLVRGLDRAKIAQVPLAVGAHLVALAWLTLEVRALVEPSPSFELLFDPGSRRNLAFATTATWATYGSLSLAAGVAMRSQLARYFGVALLGVVVLKLVVADLWLLDPLQRTVAFVGLGALLLASSLMYHRFRDLISGGKTG